MHVVILGAGATGLAAAYLLRRAGVEVSVVESAQEPGGLLATFSLGEGEPLECYYHHFFTHDAELHWLLEELELTARLAYFPTTMAVYRAGRSWPFSTPMDVLRFRAIPFWDRIRFGISGCMLTQLRSYTQQENLSALQWFRRWAGPRATEAIWQPLLQGKFGDWADRVSLAWLAGRLRQRAYSRQTGREQLGYLRGSLRGFVDRLVEQLKSQQVALHWGCPVESLVVENSRVVGVRAAGKLVPADSTVATMALPIVAELVRPISAEYARQLDAVEYLSAVCMVLRVRGPLTEAYWTNVADPECEFVGLVAHTRFVPAEWYGGWHVVYLTRYLQPGDPLWSLSDEALQERWIGQLERMTGCRVRTEIDAAWVFRARYAAPLPDLNFSQRIPAMRTPLEGLYVADMVHIYPDERSVNNCIRVAAELVRTLGFPDVADQVPRGLSLAGQYT